MKIAGRFAGLLLLFGLVPCFLGTTTTQAQSSRVDVIGVISVTQPLNGLGFNIDLGQDWQIDAAADAGAKQMRIQCGWDSVEKQSAPPENVSRGFVMPPACVSAIARAKARGIHPTIVAAFGSPYHQILTVTNTDAGAVGDFSLSVQIASGVGGDTLGKIAFPYDHIKLTSDKYISSKHSYAGTLITGVTLTDATHAKLELASALTVALAAGSVFKINELLYPSARTDAATDESVIAYCRYAKFLASYMASQGVQGKVELWNEPPWSGDPWDNRYSFYDKPPAAQPGIGPTGASVANFGFVANLQADPSPVPGETYIWGGTHKSGANSLLLPRFLTNSGVAYREPGNPVSEEAFHPYGNTPEDVLWTTSCLEDTVRGTPKAPANFAPCNFFGAAGGNIGLAVQRTLYRRTVMPSYGIAHSITETGLNQGDSAHKTRFVMRQFLASEAAGISPIQFFKMHTNDGTGYSFTDASRKPLPQLVALSDLMEDLATIGQAPARDFRAKATPTISHYSGSFDLAVVHVVGARKGSVAASILTAVWQRSTGVKWYLLEQPPPSQVTIMLPSGYKAIRVKNLDTLFDVGFTRTGQALTFAVSDDPIEILSESK